MNPTRVNGEILQQSERLKHGDLITIIDRSFRLVCYKSVTMETIKIRGVTVHKITIQYAPRFDGMISLRYSGKQLLLKKLAGITPLSHHSVY